MRRLSLYLRELEGFRRQGVDTISSKRLGATLGYSDAQVRKDFGYFGQFGKAGVGYKVVDLVSRIRATMGTDRDWRALVIGAGNLGNALVSYEGFNRKGIVVFALFDDSPDKIGHRIGNDPGLEIRPVADLEKVVREEKIELGILAVPVEAAQGLTDRLVEAGIRGILNFAPTALIVPDNIFLGSVDLAVHLEQLAFYIHLAQAPK